MRPRIVEFFLHWLGTGFFVPDYAIMLSLAIVLGVYLCVRQADRVGLETSKVIRAAGIGILAALVSARLYVVVQYWAYYEQHLAEVFIPWSGGLASYGAYLGGTLGLLLAARRERLPIPQFLDLCAPAMALAVALGRVGCFLNGCCYGHISEVAWAVRFPVGSDAHLEHLANGLVGPAQLSLPVHPTQLYESLFALALCLFLLAYRRRQRPPGKLFALFFLLYPLGRFCIEFLRGDERGSVYVLSLPQAFSLLAIALAATALVWLRRRARPLHAPAGATI